MKFTLNIAMNVALGVGTTYITSGNNIFDPGLSLSATNPYGWDWITGVYFRYRVLQSAVTIQAIWDQGTAATTTSANQFRFYLWPSRTTSTLTSDEASAAQQPYVKTTGGFPAGNNTPMTLRNFMTTAKICGERKGSVIFDDTFAGSSTAAPSRQWYWHSLVTAGNAGSALTSSVTALVTIVYWVEWSDLNQLAST